MKIRPDHPPVATRRYIVNALGKETVYMCLNSMPDSVQNSCLYERLYNVRLNKGSARGYEIDHMSDRPKIRVADRSQRSRHWHE